VPGDVSVRADLTPPDLPTYRAAVFVIEIDSISVIGPTNLFEIVGALSTTGGLARGLDGRKQ
jgi:hypothetical protein